MTAEDFGVTLLSINFGVTLLSINFRVTLLSINFQDYAHNSFFISFVLKEWNEILLLSLKFLCVLDSEVSF